MIATRRLNGSCGSSASKSGESAFDFTAHIAGWVTVAVSRFPVTTDFCQKRVVPERQYTWSRAHFTFPTAQLGASIQLQAEPR